MSDERWNAVDDYLNGSLVGSDPDLEAALADAAAAGLPPIAVAPNQGKLLHLLARSLGARRVLEIGTLGGYSTIWLARALGEDGQVVTLEVNPEHARVARANLDRAGVGQRVEIMVGPALQTLPQLQGGEPFDLVFVDADKPSNPEYFSWAVTLTHPGSLIVVDNVVRNGAVADADSDDPAVKGTRHMIELMAREDKVVATGIQTVGSKGYDGLAVALVVT